MDPIRCSACGGMTKLIGKEPHSLKPKAEVLTFQCENCGQHEVAVARGGYLFWTPTTRG
jgi:hypothetical protein